MIIQPREATINSEPYKGIDPDTLYTTRTIIGMGLIAGTTKSAQRQKLLAEIKKGNIKAINIRTEGRNATYLIYGDHLITYLKKHGEPRT